MKVSAVICEYNPFHNGHKYQTEKIKEESDAVVAIMSGPFVQRGEPAITDKFSRARCAVMNGVDLVVELPVFFALNTAREFARGAVALADKMNAVQELVFGCECADEQKLYNAAMLLANEPVEVSEKIKKYAASGMSYPAAREKAFEGFIDAQLLSRPNNILALEYIRAIKERNSPMTFRAIKRREAYDTISAHRIREIIEDGKNADKYMPASPERIANRNALDAAVIAGLRIIEKEKLKRINEVSEGLENRIKAAADEKTIDEILAKIKTKRYTMSKIKRIMLAALLDIEGGKRYSPNYLRVLAADEKGLEILKTVKKHSPLTVVTKAADYKRANDELFALDIKASDVYSVCMNERAGMDFLTSPYIKR